jgi:hypothetical protein
MMDREYIPPSDADLGLDDCCPECGGEGGYLACIEDCCSCASGDECWVPCNVCGGEG